MKKILLITSALTFIAGNVISQTVHFQEDFSSGNLNNWSLYDEDGDGFNWSINDYGTPEGDVATSASWDADDGALTPDNWMISEDIDLTSVTGDVFLTWTVYAQDQDWADENYSVYISTNDDVASLTTEGADFNEIVGTSSEYQQKSIDISSYAGDIVHIAFRHHGVTDQFRININDINVLTPLSLDASLDEVTLNRYSQVGENNTLGLTVTNNGSTTINSITVDWNDGSSNEETINVNIPAFETATFNHPTAVNYSTTIESAITVEITEVNGSADEDPSNNNGSTIINTVSELANKAVLIEEGTGTWCGWCPRGKVAMEYMVSTYDDFIGIMVHNGDPMAVPAYDNGANFGGYPSANVDRVLLDESVSQAAFEGFYNDRKDLVSPADLSANVTGSGDDFDLEVTAKFYTEFSNANYRLGVIITENGVTGTGNNYSQANNYSGGNFGPMGGYENLPNPVPAEDMVYDFVGRELLGGYNGQPGSVPTTITDGQEASHTFSYTVPTTSTRSNIRAVAVLIDQNNGEVVNAYQFPISLANLSEQTNKTEMNIFPNPTSDMATLEFETDGETNIQIINSIGQVVFVKDVNASGSQSLEISTSELDAGIYNVILTTQNERASKRLSVVK